MRLFAILVTTLTFLSGAFAADILKSILVTYPPETPNSVVEQAKKAVVDAGGIITHEYTLIKGFAAKVGEKVIDSVSALGKDYQVLVEEDQEIQQMNGGSVGL